jgi:hypothetical protein
MSVYTECMRRVIEKKNQQREHIEQLNREIAAFQAEDADRKKI